MRAIRPIVFREPAARARAVAFVQLYILHTYGQRGA